MHIKKVSAIILPVLLLAIIFSSCNVASIKPGAVGEPGQILVVAERAAWEGVVGETFREYFIQPYPVLPQPEPIFDIRFVSGPELNELQREVKTIIFLGNINNENATTKMIRQSLGEETFQKAKDDLSINLAYREDLWADGQQIIYLFGPSDAQLIENIRSRYPQLEEKLLQADLKQIKATTYQGGSNSEDITRIKNGLGIDLRLPIDFKIAVFDSINQTIWLRREVRKTSSNILIKVMDYTQENQISEANILATRNLLGQEYITTAVKGSYMTTDDINLPIIYSTFENNGNYTLSARGIWAMENDFMGGAFLSHMVYLEDIQKVVFLDGFLYAPEQDKRPMMQRFEVIFSSLQTI